MARWEPGARERLVLAAADLFVEQGYDATTVAQISARAGLAKSTFFRHFPDKRDVLVAGQEQLSNLVVDGIRGAAVDAAAMDAVAAGLEAAAIAMTPSTLDLGKRLHAVIAANSELQERDALKNVGVTEAVAGALRQRGVPEAQARLAAQLGLLAFQLGFARWSAAAEAGPLNSQIQAALTELRVAAAELR